MCHYTIYCLELLETTSTEMNSKKDRHLMYPLQCDCMHSSDEEDEVYEFSPPQDVNNIPWIINNSRRWSDYVYHTNCIHKFVNLMNVMS